MPINTEHVTIAPIIRDLFEEHWPGLVELVEFPDLPGVEVVEAYVGDDDRFGEDRWFSAHIEPLSDYEPGVRVTFAVTEQSRAIQYDAIVLGNEFRYVGPSEPDLAIVTSALFRSVDTFGEL